jgi:hypothetical protein
MAGGMVPSMTWIACLVGTTTIVNLAANRKVCTPAENLACVVQPVANLVTDSAKFIESGERTVEINTGMMYRSHVASSHLSEILV